MQKERVIPPFRRTLLAALGAVLLSACDDGGGTAALAPVCTTSCPDWLGTAELRSRPPAGRSMREIVGISAGGAPLPLHYEVAKSLGGVAIRWDFDWQSIEPTRGQFDFAAYDAIVDGAEAAGVPLLAILDYGTTWANPLATDEYFPPADPADFGRFAAKVAERYRGRLLGYEIWNEPNVGFRFWKSNANGDPVGYAELLVAASEAIRAVDPSTPVVLGGAAFTPQLVTGAIDYLGMAFDHVPTLADRIDVAGIHTYMLYPPVAAPERLDDPTDAPLIGKLQMFEWLLHENRADAHPIWITELGWPVYGSVDRATQARYLVRGLLLAALAGAERVFVYDLRDGPHGNEPSYFPPEDAFGLFEYVADPSAPVQLVPKPSFTALRALLEVTGDRHPVVRSAGVRGLPADGYTAVFEGTGGRDVVAIWTVTTTGATVTLDRDVDVIAQDGTAMGRATKGTPIPIGNDVVYLAD